MKEKLMQLPEIVVPTGYDIDEILDMTDDFEDEEPFMREEVILRYERE